MRVLGIDPGLRNMGWGVIEVDGSRMRHLGNGVCKSEGKDLGLRLLSLHRQLTDVLCEFQPTTAAVEQTFVNKDGAGTLKLGQARGGAGSPGRPWQKPPSRATVDSHPCPRALALGDPLAGDLGQLVVRLDHLLRDRPRLAVADDPLVDLHHRHDLRAGAGEETFVGVE